MSYVPKVPNRSHFYETFKWKQAPAPINYLPCNNGSNQASPLEQSLTKTEPFLIGYLQQSMWFMELLGKSSLQGWN